MTVNPSGLPLWGGFPDITIYGGDVDKRDLMGEGPINPKTDISAAQFSSHVDHTQAIAKTSSFARFTFQNDDTDGYAPAFVSYNGQHASGTTYAPTATRIGNGHYRFTWATSYTDSYGQTSSFAIVDAFGSVHGSTPGYITPKIISANVVDVYAWNAAGTALSNSKITLNVAIGSV